MVVGRGSESFAAGGGGGAKRDRIGTIRGSFKIRNVIKVICSERKVIV